MEEVVEKRTMFASKLPRVGASIFSKMSSLANRLGAINLSQGFPDFPSDQKLIDLVNKYMLEGKNQYAPMTGLPSLLEKIALKMNKSYQSDLYGQKNITITSGATQAIYTCIAATINPGDEVIIFTPAYDCYAPAIELHGGKVIEVPLYPPDYKIDWDHVKGCLNPKTKMIIINTPHNPSGTVLEEVDFERLTELVRDTNILVLSDEVYEHIVFDEHSHKSIVGYPELFERSFATFSFGKTFHNTGWKMGYCVAPEWLTNEFRKIHQYLVFSCNAPIQYALSDYISDQSTYGQVSEMYEQKRDLFLNALEGSKFEYIPSKGTYFQLLDYSNISDEADTEFAVKLTEEKGIASIPTSVFYAGEVSPKVLRFCFAKKEETLLQAADILRTIGR
ncbi:MAG: methionine aminotransferase [Flavobacteriales bacterium]|nr:methionine aminotransferase [Flavobacteriales bacterium]